MRAADFDAGMVGDVGYLGPLSGELNVASESGEALGSRLLDLCCRNNDLCNAELNQVSSGDGWFPHGGTGRRGEGITPRWVPHRGTRRWGERPLPHLRHLSKEDGFPGTFPGSSPGAGSSHPLCQCGAPLEEQQLHGHYICIHCKTITSGCCGD